MTCNNLLCTHQRNCAFPLQCLLYVPKTIADVSTSPIKFRICDQCVFITCSTIGCAFPLVATYKYAEAKTFKFCATCRPDTKLRCPIIGCYYNNNNLLRPEERVGLTDKQLVEKIERGNVLLAEDLRELIERFKAYSKLT